MTDDLREKVLVHNRIMPDDLAALAGNGYAPASAADEEVALIDQPLNRNLLDDALRSGAGTTRLKSRSPVFRTYATAIPSPCISWARSAPTTGPVGLIGLSSAESVGSMID